MKKIIFLVFSFVIVFGAQAQFTITSGQTADQLAQHLAGIGVTISNANLTCATGAFGQFSNAPSGLGITNGVVLSTGLVTDIPDAVISFASSINSTPGDLDLDILTAPYPSNDACVLDFDINVIGDSLKFNYVFSSEEYTSFVCNGFNDAFGFFITGPIPGGGSYATQNIALIPGTNTPVSINTVNDGTPNGTDAGCIATNVNFYNFGVTDVVFDGNTVVLEAFALTVPCATYHFKLAVADGGDSSYDSGVFLEAGSFSSTGVIVASGTVLGVGFNTLVEGCVDGEITFTLEDGVNNTGFPIPFGYSFGGTATHLVDFVQIPFSDTIWVLPGDSTATLSIITVSDNIPEPIETIEIYISNSCGSTLVSSIDISDVIPLTISPPSDSICNGDSVQLTMTGAQTYTWLNPNGVSNPGSGTVNLTPTTTTNYVVQYVLGNCTSDTTITIGVSGLTAQLLSNDVSCQGANNGSITVNAINGIGDITYNWFDGSTDSIRNGLAPDIYCLSISDQGGCTLDTLCDTIFETITTLELTAEDTFVCVGNKTLLTVFNNYQGSVDYNWFPANAVQDSLFNNTIYTSSITTDTTIYVECLYAAGCQIYDTIHISAMDLDIASDYSDTTVAYGTPTDIGVHIVSQNNLQEAISYDWRPVTYLSSSTQENTIATPLDNILYSIFAEASGCQDSANIQVWVGIDLQMPDAFSPNGDGVNDVFNPVLVGANVLDFRVYNSWGMLIFNNPNTGWDGKYSGVQQAIGQYTYYIRVSNGLDEEIKQGSFNLIN